VILYGAIGLLLVLLFTRLSSSIETAHSNSAPTWFHLGLHHSRRVVLKLSALFGLDAFAGGFVVQSLIAYWFHIRFGAHRQRLGESSLERISWPGFLPLPLHGWQRGSAWSIQWSSLTYPRIYCSY
jgi:hypothetical protein